MIIKHVSMANHLLKNNIRLRAIDRDKTDRSRLIFVFEDSKELFATMREFKNFKKDDDNDIRQKGDNEMAFYQ